MTEPLLRSSRHVKPEQPRGCRTWSSAELPWGHPRPPGATRATLPPARSPVLLGSGSQGTEVSPGCAVPPGPSCCQAGLWSPAAVGNFLSVGPLHPSVSGETPRPPGRAPPPLVGRGAGGNPGAGRALGAVGLGQPWGSPLPAPQLSLLLAAALGAAALCPPTPGPPRAALEPGEPGQGEQLQR